MRTKKGHSLNITKGYSVNVPKKEADLYRSASFLYYI